MRTSLLVLPLSLVLTGAAGIGVGTWYTARTGSTTVLPSEPVGSDTGASGSAAAPAQGLPLELDLNLPAFQLDTYEGGVRTRRYSVAVGMRKYKTPRGIFEITSVEWNPWWIPPPAEWARHEHITPPGWSNPMGRAKLNFLPLYFLHGTPFEESRGRAASHGCVRMANADVMALAQYVQSMGSPAPDAALFDSLAADTSLTLRMQLTHPVPIRIRYDVADVADDTLFLYRDMYSLDRRSDQQRALAALSVAGIEATGVDQRQLRKRLKSTSRRPLKIPLSDVRIGQLPAAPPSGPVPDREVPGGRGTSPPPRRQE